MKKIQQAKDWQTRLRIAEGKSTGSEYDPILQKADFALQFKDAGEPVGILANQFLKELGTALAVVCGEGNSTALRGLADVLDEMKSATPEQRRDNVAALVLALAGPQNQPVAIRDVLKNLKHLKDNQNPDSAAKRARRLAKKFGIPTDHTSGRPKADKRAEMIDRVLLKLNQDFKNGKHPSKAEWRRLNQWLNQGNPKS